MIPDQNFPFALLIFCRLTGKPAVNLKTFALAGITVSLILFILSTNVSEGA